MLCGPKVPDLSLPCPHTGVLQVCALSCSHGLAGGACRAEPLSILAMTLGEPAPNGTNGGTRCLQLFPQTWPWAPFSSLGAVVSTGLLHWWFLRCVDRGDWLLQPTHAVEEQSGNLKPTVALVRNSSSVASLTAMTVLSADC